MKALLLDLDRTLVDVQTFTDYESAVDDVQRALGPVDLIGVPETEWRSATRTAMAMLVALSGDADRWQLASDLIERHERHAVTGATAMPGLDAFLNATQHRARSIVTLMGPGAMDMVCERFRIDVATRVGRSADLAPKPAPDQVARACLLLGIDRAGRLREHDLGSVALREYPVHSSMVVPHRVDRCEAEQCVERQRSLNIRDVDERDQPIH